MATYKDKKTGKIKVCYLDRVSPISAKKEFKRRHPNTKVIEWGIY